MQYTRQEIIYRCEEALKDSKTFYQCDFVNYIGRTTDTKDLYTEVIAEFLCDNINNYVKGIPQITRNSSYKMLTHMGQVDKDTSREEERIAIEMFNQSQNGVDYTYIGKIIDYQTPLKNKRSDIAGKIDLLAYDGKCVRILELKRQNSEESMLRCVLEGFTYLKTVDSAKLLNNFNIMPNTRVRACPFVFKGSSQHREMSEQRPFLFKLMKLLDSEPFYITTKGNLYIVEK